MKKCLLSVCVLILLSHWSSAQNLTVVTTTWAPYNMEENGVISGIGTEIVQATLEKAGIKAEIQLYPWARAYKMASEDPNTMIYTMVRLPNREALFKWVGPIMPPIRVSLLKLKKRTDIAISTLEDAKKYKIGVVRNTSGHQFLLNHGFQDGTHIEPVDANAQDVQKLFAERIDLDTDASLVAAYEATKLGLAAKDLEDVLVLFEIEGYMGFSQKTPDELVERVKTAFEEVKAAGIINAIIEKYLKIYQ